MAKGEKTLIAKDVLALKRTDFKSDIKKLLRFDNTDGHSRLRPDPEKKVLEFFKGKFDDAVLDGYKQGYFIYANVSTDDFDISVVTNLKLNLVDNTGINRLAFFNSIGVGSSFCINHSPTSPGRVSRARRTNFSVSSSSKKSIPFVVSIS